MFLYLMRVQVFSKNMNKMEAPQITNCERGLNWTKATFKPDLTKFKMTNLDENDVPLMRRVIDIAATFGETVDVKLVGNCVHVWSFLQYVKLVHTI
jgi:DNA topoisomerase-2